MPLCDAETSLLLVIDFQTRLMPAIAEGDAAVAQTRKLLAAADLVGVPVVYTEQNPRGLGPTVPDLAPAPSAQVVPKMSFGGWATPALKEAIPAGREVIVTGCEAHICVLQTVLGLLADGRRVKVVRDAVGSRRAMSLEAALARMSQHGAEVVTTEMVVFEWLGSAEHPRFKDAIGLIK